MGTKFSTLFRCTKSTRFLLALGAAAILSVGVALASSITSFVFFELDGNAKADGTADDWQTLVTTGGSAAHGFQLFTGVLPDPGKLNPTGGTVTDQTVFSGSNKDTLDSSTWTGGAGSIPPKDDITNAYAAAYAGSNSHQIIVFGADRFSNNGDADLGFWFFQKSISFNSTSGTFSAGHTAGNTSGAVGDILVLTNFSQTSGFTGTVEVLEWFPECDVSGSSKTGGHNFVDARCLDGEPLLVLQAPTTATCGSGIEPATVCAISNTSPVQLYWPYLPETTTTGGDCTSSTNCAPAGSFFEGAIDLTALIGNTCLSSFLAETRSSTSETATLKDFVGPHPLNLCGISIQKSCPSNTVAHTANGDIFKYTFGGVVQNTGFGIDHNVTVIDTFPTDFSTLSAPNQTTCPSGSPAGAICFSLGDMNGKTCKLWPNNTAIDCATLVSGADPHASTDFANNTFESLTNSASNAASVQSTEISAGPTSVVCPMQSGMPAINVAKTCTAHISNTFAVSVSYSGDVCNESNLTLSVSSEPTDVQLIPTGTGTTATPNATYCTPAGGGVCTPKTLPFSLAPCTANVVDGTKNTTPCTPTQTCSDNGAACTTDANCSTSFPTCTNGVCTSCPATAAGVCQHYTGSYTPTQASSGTNAGNICFKDQVTASASSALFANSTSNTNNPAAMCTLCPSGTCQ